ncbi:type I-C CRISPR-associated protein Cas5c [Acetomicrobium sp. S15 = DSM 107314]|uniref:type I-C CRISPR-associated protein Cas5c n=1 Tax=Acetomicrobium sp. S15 = DSM 107314 TaxID=2529858 RepID=UPI0018E1BA81|nr:type I-C CRISPR-associated protein Cas5c [Acetomicrobium sp. S15 = DSM 107314]
MNGTFFNKVFCLEVAGDYACFTRPEMKVERVSYDVITPSAARGIFEAVFWKPAVRWRVRKIEVLNPITWISVRRNEVGATMSERRKEIFIENERQQRAGLFLRDVRYRLHAELEFIHPKDRSKTFWKTPEEFIPEEEEYRKDENPGKYNAIFERRARKGQCFNQPYLGCREFSCAFRLIEDLSSEPKPIDETRDLGFMLYDLDFSTPDDIKPAFFRAFLRQGVIDVPPWESEEVRR